MIYACPHCQQPTDAVPGRMVTCPSCRQGFQTPIAVAENGAPTIQAHHARVRGRQVDGMIDLVAGTGKLILILGFSWLVLSCAGIL